MSEEVTQRMAKLEDKVDQILNRISNLEGRADMGVIVIKWVVFPLVCILGAIVGVKVVLPSI